LEVTRGPKSARSGLALQQTASLFDHLVRANKQRWRNRKIQCLCGLTIYDQLEFSWRLDRQIARSCALEDAVNIKSRLSRLILDIARSYELGANCYVHKPGNLEDYFLAVQSIEEFWFGSVSLPREEK